MIATPLSDIVSATQARPEGVSDLSTLVTSVTTDSRDVRAGSLFIALKGDRVDGARFISDALSAGAVAVLTSQPGAGPRLLVGDPLMAFRSVGGLVRRRSDAKVVAITGSSGKTLTKDLTGAALAAQKRVVLSKASFNNEIGVPLTLCALELDTEVLIAEVGSRGPGHIAALAPSLAPDIAVVINVGQAHLGEFGNIETTARSKRELVEALGPDGIAVLNADDDRTRAMAAGVSKTVLFGAAADATIRLTDVDLDSRACAMMQVAYPTGSLTLTLPLPGEHLASNALAALGVAYALGADMELAARGIETATTSPGRTTLIERGTRSVLDDAYNANPDSMRAALKTLAHLGASRPTWAVLGEMAELGDSSLEAHDAIGRLAVRLGIDHLIVVGQAARAIGRAAVLEGMLPEDVHQVMDAAEAVRVLADGSEENAVILVKASRAAGLELVVAGLLNGHEANA